MKVYVTGLSGTGKTSLIRAFNERGLKAIDIDDNLCHWENMHTGETADWEPNSSDEWHDSHAYICEIGRLQQDIEKEEDIVVAGLPTNQDEMFPLFDKTFVLSCRPETMVNRIMARTDNDFGKHETEQKRLLNYKKTFEASMIEKGAIRLDAEKPLEKIVSKILSEFSNKSV